MDSQPPARPSHGAPPGVHVGDHGRAVESLEVHDIRWHVRAGLPFWVDHFGKLRMAQLKNGKVSLFPRRGGYGVDEWITAHEIPPVSYSVVKNLVAP